MTNLLIDIKRLDKKARLPQYASDGSSGFDLEALLDDVLVLRPNEWRLINTGLAVAIPYGFEMQIRPRSGLSFKKGLIVKNSPGTIDSDYRGEIKIMAYNESQDDVFIAPYERIAQGVICPIYKAVFSEVENLPATLRNDGGFGSTGAVFGAGMKHANGGQF